MPALPNNRGGRFHPAKQCPVQEKAEDNNSAENKFSLMILLSVFSQKYSFTCNELFSESAN